MRVLLALPARLVLDIVSCRVVLPMRQDVDTVDASLLFARLDRRIQHSRTLGRICSTYSNHRLDVVDNNNLRSHEAIPKMFPESYAVTDWTATWGAEL